MTIAYICVLVAMFIPYGFAAWAKFSKKGYDNRSPREFLETLDGMGKRANWVQMNSFESFPAFAAAVIIAHQLGASQGRVDVLAVIYIVARLCYGFAYVLDRSILRSVCWGIGLASIIFIFLSGA